MRKFPFPTVGTILEQLKKEDCPIERQTFRRLEKEGLFVSRRSAGGWRVYSKAEVAIIVQLIKENYAIEKK